VADRDDLLVAALRDLGAGLDTGPVPDVAPAVLARVAGTVPRRPLLARAGLRERRLRAFLAALLAAGLTAVPAVREAAADVAGAVVALPGVLVRAGDAPAGSRPSAAPGPPAVAAAGPLGRELGYTRAPVTLDEARRRAAATLRLPARLGPPDEVYVLGPGGRAVSMLWAARPGLPALPGSRAGLVLDVVTPSDLPFFEKYTGSLPTEPVRVAGRDGVWIGGRHELVPIGEDGRPRYDLGRQAAGTLILPLPGGTVRIESALDRDAAVRLAGTLS
jgi:hypothetical protein